MPACSLLPPWSWHRTKEQITGGDGRFVLEYVPTGSITLEGHPEDGSGYALISADQQIAGNGTIDLGDVEIKRRPK